MVQRFSLIKVLWKLSAILSMKLPCEPLPPSAARTTRMRSFSCVWAKSIASARSFVMRIDPQPKSAFPDCM